MLLDGDDNASKTFKGHRPLKFGRKKTSKILYVLRQFSGLTANVFGLDRDVNKQ